MEMHQVRYFLAVAEQLNFTRAADRLHVAQPSLTRAIQKLEDELGGPLFRRERGNTHLTELGRMMLPHLAASLAAADAAKAQAESFHKREIGQLAMGVCVGVAADLGARLLGMVCTEFADLSVRVDVAPASLVEERLMSGNLDAALILLASGAGESGLAIFAHERFDIRVLARDAIVAAFPPGHRFDGLDEIRLENLDGEPLAVWLGSDHEGALAAAMAARGVTRSVRHTSTDERWLAEIVGHGLACILWPESIARRWNLLFRRLVDLPVCYEVALTTVAGRRYSPALAALVRRAEAMARAGIEAGSRRLGGVAN